jgi:hypothetical protein
LSPFQTPANTPTVLLCRLLRKRLLLGTLYCWRSHHRRYLRHRPRKSRSNSPLRSFLMFSLSITPLVAVISRAVAQCRVGVVQRKTHHNLTFDHISHWCRSGITDWSVHHRHPSQLLHTVRRSRCWQRRIMPMLRIHWKHFRKDCW